MPNTASIQASDGIFDPKAFLGRADAGKTIERYVKNQKIFSQGDIADTLFYIQKGKVKITVLSEHGKRWSGLSRRASSSAKGVSRGCSCAPPPARPWKNA